MSEYQDMLRQRVAGLPPLQKVMINLDVALTGHEPTEVVRQYHHYPVSLEHWIKRDGFQFIWYLSDSGYSRVVWNEENGQLFLTDNSRREVKANWEAALPQRQAVEQELRRQWDEMGSRMEAENPKDFLKRHAPPRPLKDGQYTVYLQFADEQIYENVYMEDGWLYFMDAPYAIGQKVQAVVPGLENDPFYAEVGKYTSPIEQAAAEGRTSGVAEGVAGIAPFRIDYEGPLEYADGGNADIQAEALELADMVMAEADPDQRRRLNRIYNQIWRGADDVIKRTNPCQVCKNEKGEVTCNSPWGAANTLCCTGCEHHSPEGCKADRPATCKTWLCPTAAERMPPEERDRLNRMARALGKHNLYTFRGSKQQALAKATHKDPDLQRSYYIGGKPPWVGEARTVIDALLESPRFPTLKANRRSLSPEEKAEAGDAPVWKATVNGKTWYVCNTHRSYEAKPTVKGAAHAWHHGVEQSG